MKKWYQENYINRRDWILEHCDKLKLSAEEILLLLQIDYLSSNHIQINTKLLESKMKLSEAKLDKLLQSLCAKNILLIRSKSKISYDMSPLFELNLEEEINEHVKDVFVLFQKEFGRLLTRDELIKIQELLQIYNQKELIKALQIASAYKKMNLKYIEKVLINGK